MHRYLASCGERVLEVQHVAFRLQFQTATAVNVPISRALALLKETEKQANSDNALASELTNRCMKTHSVRRAARHKRNSCDEW